MNDFALHNAVKQGCLETVVSLVNNGCDINAKDLQLCTPLHLAVLSEREKIFEDSQIYSRNSPIETRSQYSHVERNLVIAKMLIQAGADVNIQDYLGSTALHSATKQNSIAFIEMLMQCSIDVSIEYISGVSALEIAIDRDYTSIAKLLIGAGAEVNALDSKGQMPLHSATMNSNFALVEFLLTAGAHVNARDSGDQTALHYAMLLNSDDENQLDLINALLINGANVNAQDQLGKTPFHNLFLLRSFSIAEIQLFLSFGADVNVPDARGKTPFVYAIRSGGNVKIIQLLIEHGADVSYVNPSSGFTPMHCSNEITIIKMLVNSGAKIEVVDFHGRTPLLNMTRLSFTQLDCYVETLKFFLEHGSVNAVDSNGVNILTNISSSGLSWKIILEHLAKLKALDLPLHSSLLKSISDKKEFSSYFGECLSELIFAKRTKLKHSWVTFFNLLVNSKKKLKNFAGNNDLVEYFERSDCKKIFPIYGDGMLKNMVDGIWIRRWFDNSAELLSDCLPILNPTHLIVRDVLDCLSPNEMLKLNEPV